MLCTYFLGNSRETLVEYLGVLGDLLQELVLRGGLIVVVLQLAAEKLEFLLGFAPADNCWGKSRVNLGFPRNTIQPYKKNPSVGFHLSHNSFTHGGIMGFPKGSVKGTLLWYFFIVNPMPKQTLSRAR